MNTENNPMSICVPSSDYKVPFRWANGMPTVNAIFIKPDNIFSDGDEDDGDEVEARIGVDSGTPYNVLSYDLLCSLYEAGVLDDGHTVVRSEEEWVVIVDRIELKEMVIENIPFNVFDCKESWFGASLLNALDSYCIDYKNMSVVFNCIKKHLH